MKSIKILLVCLLFPFTSFAATQYVSDDLSIFMHSGPSTKYRIIGSIEVGTKLTTLRSNNATKFTQIKTPAGKVGWVNSTQIQNEEPAKTL